MAGIIRCRFSVRSVLSTLYACLVITMQKIKLMWKLAVRHHYSLGIAFSVLLFLLNFIVYNQGCHNWKHYFDPVKLSHGYVPVFPSHYFHNPSTDPTDIPVKELSVKEPEKVDAYFNYHITKHKFLSSDIPPAVHIVWCDRGPFTFTHYINVLAAFKIIIPSMLTLHWISEPELDPDGYFQFLPDLQRDLPPLVTKTLKHTAACSGDAYEKTIAFMKLLGTTGGIVISGRAVLIPSPSLDILEKRKLTIGHEGDKSSQPLLLAAQANVLSDIPTKNTLDAFVKQHSIRYLSCESVNKLSFTNEPICVNIQEDIFPVMIFKGSSHFDLLARWVVYGSSRTLLPTPADSIIVPNIVHYVWLGKNKLNFFGYLSILSSLNVMKADSVFVHGDIKPLGEYWEKVEKNPKVKFIHRDFPNSVFGEPIIKFASHASDYLRGDVLLRYGGVYVDWDVIFLKELPHSMRKYNTTANVDWPETGAFPDVFNLGVLVAAPGAPFIRHFLESYRWYLDGHWSYNAIHMPYKVYEKLPASLNVDRHLQILCAVDKCHATWLKNYKEESEDHLNTNKFDWKKDAVAIHWTHPDPQEFSNQENLLAVSSVTSEIGKHVLKMSKLIS